MTVKTGIEKCLQFTQPPDLFSKSSITHGGKMASNNPCLLSRYTSTSMREGGVQDEVNACHPEP